MSIKSVVVVGGASGIGLEAARHFVTHGAATTIVDVNADKLREAESALAMPGARLLGMAADVRDRDSLHHAFAQGAARHKGIDALRSEEHTSELQSLMRISYAVFCLKK